MADWKFHSWLSARANAPSPMDNGGMKPAYWSMVIWASEDQRAWIVGVSFPTQQSLNTWQWAHLPTLTSTEDSPFWPRTTVSRQVLWTTVLISTIYPVPGVFLQPILQNLLPFQRNRKWQKVNLCFGFQLSNGTTLHTLYLYIEDSSTEVSLRINESGHCVFMWPFLCTHKSWASPSISCT